MWGFQLVWETWSIPFGAKQGDVQEAFGPGYGMGTLGLQQGSNASETQKGYVDEADGPNWVAPVEMFERSWRKVCKVFWNGDGCHSTNGGETGYWKRVAGFTEFIIILLPRPPVPVVPKLPPGPPPPSPSRMLTSGCGLGHVTTSDPASLAAFFCQVQWRSFQDSQDCGTAKAVHCREIGALVREAVDQGSSHNGWGYVPTWTQELSIGPEQNAVPCQYLWAPSLVQSERRLRQPEN